MNAEEFKTFSRRLFVAFPSLWEWLQRSSPAPKETLALWQEQLARVPLDAAMRVVDDWHAGRLPLFGYADRDRLPALVARIVFDRARADVERSERRQRATDYVASRQRRAAYQPTATALPSVADAFRRGQRIKAELMDGTDDETKVAEVRRRLAEITEQL